MALDGRLGLRAMRDTSYDLIVNDAFSSDAIPTHLITREAVTVYESRLKARGVIAFHVMNSGHVLATIAALAMVFPPFSANAVHMQQPAAPRETRVPIGKASLYAREIGNGQPVIVLHGGPDFDHAYLLPDLDRLSDSLRLLYYDQRGRGKSAAGVQPDDVTLLSDVEDVDRVRQHFRLQSTALLGHSWGALLALEYALRYPTRVSHVILMNPAPLSGSELAVFRKAYVRQLGADMNRQREIAASAAYREGDPETVAARYRIHFKHALVRPGDYEKLMGAMKGGFSSQGKEGILKARAVEDRLMRDTWQLDGYDLLPKLRTVTIPTLIISGDHDFIPSEIAARIAAAMPNARLVALTGCGHFAYLECAGDVRIAINEFFRRDPRTPRLD